MNTHTRENSFDASSIDVQQYRDTICLKSTLQSTGDILVLAFGELTALLQDNDLGTEPMKSLRHFECNVASA